MGKVAIHKEINRLPISFENENTINCFVGILKEFSKTESSEIKKFTKQKIWELAYENDRFRDREFLDLISDLTKSYFVKYRAEHLGGSIFLTKILDDGIHIEIALNPFYREKLFSNRDLHLISKAKKKERMTTEELDYWDTVLRDKKKELMLLEEAELRGIRGKYAKRFYMLLKQFSKTGYFCMSISDFRDVMEVPEAYTLGAMNKEVINRAKAELEKKNLFKFQDESKGKGRRKIEKIEVNFQSLMPDSPTIEKKLDTSHNNHNDFENKVSSKNKANLTPEEEREAIRLCVQSGDVSESFLKTMKKKNQSMYWNMLSMALKNS